MVRPPLGYFNICGYSVIQRLSLGNRSFGHSCDPWGDSESTGVSVTYCIVHRAIRCNSDDTFDFEKLNIVFVEDQTDWYVVAPERSTAGLRCLTYNHGSPARRDRGCTNGILRVSNGAPNIVQVGTPSKSTSIGSCCAEAKPGKTCGRYAAYMYSQGLCPPARDHI